MKVIQAPAGTMDLSRQEVDSGKGYPRVKDLAGPHDWEATWDRYRAPDTLEKSVSNRETYSAFSRDFALQPLAL